VKRFFFEIITLTDRGKEEIRRKTHTKKGRNEPCHDNTRKSPEESKELRPIRQTPLGGFFEESLERCGVGSSEVARSLQGSAGRKTAGPRPPKGWC